MGRVIKKEEIETNELNLQINYTNVKVSYGDIFSQKPYKVIAFNEYFDTIVDDNIITTNSLNGIYIKDYVDNQETLNEVISAQINENNFKIGINNERKKGKKTKCKLGSVIKYSDFLLLAFSRFDKEDKAFITKADYYICMKYFWEQIDRLYAGYQISIPLLGSGVTRIDMTDQELLWLLIATFKDSNVKLAGKGLNIILYDKEKPNVNLSLFK